MPGGRWCSTGRPWRITAQGLVRAAIDNQQVFWLLGDGDVSAFYGKLVEGLSGEEAEKIRAEINN